MFNDLKTNYKKTSLTLDSEDYILFKKICKVNHSDASKEMRKMIEQYIKENRQTVANIKMGIEK